MLGYRSPYSVDWQSPINWSDSLTRGLVGRWIVAPHLSGGARWHELVGGAHGTLTNMDPATDWNKPSSVGSNPPYGQPWGSLDFDGSNDYVTCGNLSRFNVTSVTIAALIASPGAPSSDAGIIGKGSYASNGYHIAHAGTAGSFDHKMYFVISTSGGTTFLPGTTLFNDSTARHVCCTYDGATMRVYVDGKEEANSTARTGNIYLASTTDLEFGRRPGSSVYFSGQIDDVCIYDRALSSGEVYSLHVDSHDYHRRTLRRWSRRFSAIDSSSVTGSPWYYYAQQQAVTA